ncbi:MAG: alpha/beta hydrolase [Sphingomonas fennica]
MAPRGTSPARRPFWFEGRFGWLHLPPAGVAWTGRPGVLLCGAYAQEEVCSRHGLLLLADALAAAGIPTLRFDWLGSGDSAGGAVSFAGMVADVRLGAAALVQETGVSTVALLGLRIGAAAALTAAAGMGGLAGIGLLAPVLAGQAFLRETRASASVAPLALLDPVPRAGAGPLNANGFRWEAGFQQELAALDLTHAPAPAVSVLAMAAPGDKRLPQLAAAWSAAGAAPTAHPFAEYPAYMRDPTTHVMPHAAWAQVVEWAAGLAAPAASIAPVTPVAVADRLAVDDYEEMPCCFGPEARVFGMLCRPAGQAPAGVAALLLHEGSTHHIGNGGAYVALARRLAAAGIASIRIDPTGTGDSRSDGSDRNAHYDLERLSEISDAIDVVAAAGSPAVVSFGLCSGAYTAYQAALADERVVGVVTINIQKFVWHYGDDIRVAPGGTMKRTLRSYLRSMRNPGEWKRALAGDADLIGIARVLAARGLARTGHALRALLPPKPGSEIAIVREEMARLGARRAHLHFMFSDEDPGLAEIALHFGGGGRRLKAHPRARLHVFPRADHHFNGWDARARYFAIVEEAMQAVIAEHGDSLPAALAVAAE